MQSGLTFIELTVVISIIGILAGIILFNYGNFSGGISVENTAQEVALSINEAQRYAISGAGNGHFGYNPNDQTEKPTYGIYLDPKTDSKSYIFYKDLNENRQYDDIGGICPGNNSGNDLCQVIVTINTGDYISGMSGVDFGGSTVDLTTSAVDVTFQRPYPDAIIKDRNGQNYEQLTIELTSGKGGIKKDVIIYFTGQVQVENTP